VAKKLGRKWITTDLGRFSVHTARKRLIGVQRELQESGKDYRAFELLNLGKYERQFFMDERPSPPQRCGGGRSPKEDLYVDLILEAYKAKRIDGHSTLHGSKAGRFVNVGPLDVPVTQSRLMDIFEECRQKLYTQVDVLGFEFEMGLIPQFIQELKEKGVSVTLKYIPKDVYDKRAVEKGQVKFFDVAYLNTKEKIIPSPSGRPGGAITIELTDFVTHYTQDNIEELQQSMRGGSKVVIEDGQIFKIEKDKNGIITRTVLSKNWFDWIDYRAIDFNYEDKKEIIKVKNDKDETEDKWSGNYLFENEWQSYRTKKNLTLEFLSI
jgi:adenine-specific DNA-methyltransferase